MFHNGKLSFPQKNKNKNSPSTTSQDQALCTSHPAQRRANKHENQRKPCLSISLAHPASQVCMYGTCTQLSRTADIRNRSNHEDLPSHINSSEFAATRDGSLRLVMVRCDSVLIQDCELSQRKSISLRFFMPLNLRILLKTRRRKLERRISRSGPN